ncbi:hypothetical protein INR49_026765 [Caranx melampygus]|nr:hypothetical protein INR49_026765 [Caranx melampygus]
MPPLLPLPLFTPSPEICLLDIGPIGPDRNWKGIGISLLVILLVLSLIGLAIVLLSKDDSGKPFGSQLTLDDLFQREFQYTTLTQSGLMHSLPPKTQEQGLSSASFEAVLVLALALLLLALPLLALPFLAQPLLLGAHGTLLGFSHFLPALAGDITPSRPISVRTTPGEEIIFQSWDGDVLKISTHNNETDLLLKNTTFATFKASKFAVSPDLNFVLLGYDVKQVRTS